MQNFRNRTPTHYALRSDVEIFLGHCVDSNLALCTISTYRQSLERLGHWMQVFYPEAHSVTDLRPAHLQQFRRHLREDSATYGHEISLRTQAKYLAIVRSLLRFYTIEARLEVMSREQIKLPKAEDKEATRSIQPDEVAALLDQPDPAKPWGLRDRALIAVLSSTGFRVSELCALDRRELRTDLMGRQARLSITVGHGRRTAYLDERAQGYLLEYLGSRSDKYPALFIRHKPGKSADQDDSQHRLTRQMVDRLLAKYARRAALSVLPSANSFRARMARDGIVPGAARPVS